jgi:hypothetical protein
MDNVITCKIKSSTGLINQIMQKRSLKSHMPHGCFPIPFSPSPNIFHHSLLPLSNQGDTVAPSHGIELPIPLYPLDLGREKA